jgi:hypothetical protein
MDLFIEKNSLFGDKPNFLEQKIRKIGYPAKLPSYSFSLIID